MDTDIILVAEDEPTTSQMLVDVLEDAGYAVILAKTGPEALSRLDEHRCSIVLSDIRMPGIDGISVLQHARKIAEPPEVILLTGYGSLDTSISALREGAFDYLIKPCHPATLLERVAEALEARQHRLRQESAIKQVMHAVRDITPEDLASMDETYSPESAESIQTDTLEHQKESSEDVLEVGKLKIGQDHFMATFDGEAIHLTPMEHAMLHCLAQRPGHVFRYKELVYHVHGYDVSSAEARILLKTHVRNVRQKIGTEYLVNIRSTGYKLVDPATEPAEEHYV